MESGESSDKDAAANGATGFVCNMNGGSWESLPYPIVVDSGASASVTPEKWCEHVQLHETEASKRCIYYTAANGHKIYNKGERQVTMMSREDHLRKKGIQLPREGFD